MSLLAKRFTSQLLAGAPARDATAVVERLLAVQAQDGRGARLAVRVRSTGLTAADVDRALTDGSLVVTWLNRGTLHLVRSEDYHWLHALTAPRLRTGNARRLSQEGVSPGAAERGVAVIERSLADEGPLDRNRLRARVAAAGVRTEGQALVHLLALASIRGAIVRGPMHDGKHAYALVRDWLPPARPVDRDRALAELARRYLAGHGPADAADLAWWAGLPLRDARAGLAAIASELRQSDGGLLDVERAREPSAITEARLFGAYEPVLLGWRSRRLVLGDDAARVVSGGLFRPFALVRGRPVATWSISREGFRLDPFRRLTRADRAALDADALDVTRFLAG